MARHKIDPAISRAAYAAATKALKEQNAEQFAALLDKAYSDLDTESPRQRSIRLQQEADLKRLHAEQKRQARKQAKIEEAKALLREQGIDVDSLIDESNDIAFGHEKSA